MSINHYYSSDLQEAHHHQHHWYWPLQQQYINAMDSSSSSSPPNHNYTTTNHSHSTPLHHNHQASMFTSQNNNNLKFNLNNINNEDDEEINDEHNDDNNNDDEIPKEPLFEKPLTPSDVGKLNRLVIPKQHAEKYFPLNNGGSDSGEKGFLLGFEDEVGKSWSFRYSYWNSSQSYVLTKGWSRFVKEKRLDAGDVVLFFRHRIDAGRLFIGWRRRQETGVAQPSGGGGDGGGGWGRVLYSGHPYPSQKQHHGPSANPPHQPDHYLNAGTLVQHQTPASSVNSRRLRLFGVNLAVESSEPSTPEASPMSSQGQAHHPRPNYIYHQYYSNNNHMDMISFSGADHHHVYHR